MLNPPKIYPEDVMTMALIISDLDPNDYSHSQKAMSIIHKVKSGLDEEGYLNLHVKR
jgi:hypothetical protein